MKAKNENQRSHQERTVGLEHDQWVLAASEALSQTGEERDRVRAVAKTLRRVGFDAEGQARWLFTFERNALGDLSEKERATIRRELLVFLMAQLLPGTTEISKTRFAKHVARGTIEYSGQIPSAADLTLSENDTEKLHAWLKEGIGAIMAGKRIPFEFVVKASVGLSSSTDEGEAAPLQFFEQRSGQNIGEMFAGRVYETLRASAHTIRRCADCRALFVLSHGLEMYCSKRCSQRVRTRAYRHKPENQEKVREIRRNQYVREMAKKRPATAQHMRKRAQEEGSK